MSLVLQSSGGGQITIQEPAIASNFTQDLPAVTGNVVIDSATQTLTNKTLTSPTIDGTPTGVGVLTSGTAVASTSGTSIDFTSIPSWVKRVTVMFNAVSTNGSSIPQIQLGSGSFVTSGYVGSAAIAADGNAPAVANMSTGFLLEGATLDSFSLRGSVTLTLIDSNIWIISGVIGQSDSTRINWCGGAVAVGGVLDRVRITTVNGTDTFDAGSINILYE
jgi:hypothetical protein